MNTIAVKLNEEISKESQINSDRNIGFIKWWKKKIGNEKIFWNWVGGKYYRVYLMLYFVIIDGCTKSSYLINFVFWRVRQHPRKIKYKILLNLIWVTLKGANYSQTLIGYVNKHYFIYCLHVISHLIFQLTQNTSTTHLSLLNISQAI